MKDARGILLAVVVLVVGLVGVLLVGRGDPGSGRPLDPRSHSDAGTSAVVALVDELGVDVDVDVREVGADVDAALLLWDQLDAAERDDLEDWVAAGGTLVVTDPSSPFAPPGGGLADALEDDPDALTGEEPVEVDVGECDIEPLEDLDTLAVWGGPIRYRVSPDDRSCFGNGDRAFVVQTPFGDGNVVAFGGSGTVVNHTLADADNAPAIAALLAPTEGGRVAVIDIDLPPLRRGDDTLTDVMPTSAKRVLVQLGLALLVFVAWRARRLGQPVPEPQPVKVAASELVAAMGGMLERSGSPQHAADVLRAELRRELVTRLGLPPNVPPTTLVEVVAPRTTLDEARLAAALGPGPVSTDRDLLTVVTLIDIVRKEVFAHVGS
ncbi:MAG TPA: DUF4350 domain-containing protein [Acidimicrobiales bacterium]